MKISSKATCIALVFFLGINLVSRAGDLPAANPFLNVLSVSPQAELPGKAADLVVKADAKNQRQTTIDVVRAAVGLNPAAAPAIVGSIAQSAPNTAAIAASTAVSLVPNQAVAIARAAAAATPKQAGKIVEAVCRIVPKSYKAVADAVAEVAPGASKEILMGVSTAIPALKDSINQVLMASKGNTPSVATVLEQAASADVPTVTTANAGPVSLSPGVNPIVLPPYSPPPGAPGNIDPGSGGPQPPGGRNYTPP